MDEESGSGKQKRIVPQPRDMIDPSMHSAPQYRDLGVPKERSGDCTKHLASSISPCFDDFGRLDPSTQKKLLSAEFACQGFGRGKGTSVAARAALLARARVHQARGGSTAPAPPSRPPQQTVVENTRPTPVPVAKDVDAMNLRELRRELGPETVRGRALPVLRAMPRRDARLFPSAHPSRSRARSAPVRPVRGHSDIVRNRNRASSRPGGESLTHSVPRRRSWSASEPGTRRARWERATM